MHVNRRPHSHLHTGRESRPRTASANGSPQWIEVIVTPRDREGKRVRRSSFFRWMRNDEPEVQPRNPRVATSRLGDQLTAWVEEHGLRDAVQRIDVETMDRFLAVILTTTSEVRDQLERDPELQDLMITDRIVVN